MVSSPNKWTPEECAEAINVFLDSEEGQRFCAIFSRESVSPDDRTVFLRDVERRAKFDHEEVRQWWNSLQALIVSEPDSQLALAEPLAQNGIGIDELYDCLPDEFDPLALRRAVDLAIGIRQGRRGAMTPVGLTNTSGWSIEQIRSQLHAVKERVGWQTASANARQWWMALETADKNKRQIESVLALAEELANRKATINDFHAASVQANTANIRAVLHYLDYTRLQAASKSVGQTLTSDDTGWWIKPAPRMTRVRGWTDEQIGNRLQQLKARLDWENTAAEICQWWQTFESENQHRLALALRLAEELANRNTTMTEFHRAFGLAQTSDVQANLRYLDYLLLTAEKFAYETVTLDEFGKVTERRREEANFFAEELAAGVVLEMVEIPGGTFLMGSPESEAQRLDREGPQHPVTVSPFYIGKFAVTQEQWNVVAGWEKIERDLDVDPARFKGSDRPVETISWEDAQEFCARLSRKTESIYRLPTEAEWEYACRAGTTTPFALGQTITPEIVNYNGNNPYANAEKGKYRGQTIPVGSLGVANAFGLFDMHGNVWEWCSDWFSDEYYQECKSQGAVTDPQGPGAGSNRVIRGGSWNSDAVSCRSAHRNAGAPGSRGVFLGFRLVRIGR